MVENTTGRYIHMQTMCSDSAVEFIHFIDKPEPDARVCDC